MPDTSGDAALAPAGVPVILAAELDICTVKRPAEQPAPGDLVAVDTDWLERTGTESLVPVAGDRMEPAGICDGDYAGVKEQLTAQSGDIVIATTPDEGTVVTIYFQILGKQYLVPANLKYPIRLMPEGATIGGVVVGVVHFAD